MSDPNGLYTAEQIRQLEQLYARFHEGSTYTLMERAGAAVYTEMREHWPEGKRILVVCGKGNNGGDGFVVARLAAQAGLEATVALAPSADAPQGDAERAWVRLKASPVHITPWHMGLAEQHDVIVDALLGTGLKGDVSEPLASIIREINRAHKPVIAVDIPSGLMADTGSVGGSAVHADVTVTFIGIKRGLTTGLAVDYCGKLVVNDLKCGQGVFALVRPQAFLYRYQDGIRFLKPRRKTSHKGFNGHTLVIGGTPGFAGAARMCAEAAARTGSGLVSLLTHPQHSDVIGLNCPEIMCHAAAEHASKEGLKSLLDAATVIAIGPGLGRFKWGKNLLAMVEDYVHSVADTRPGLVTVWDADALNLLAERPQRMNNRIITPHPGEAARLLGTSVAQVQQDRFAAIKQLEQSYGGICLLKGPGTLIAEGSKVNVVQAGNPGMATGGMGDVLTGVIAGLVAQGLPPFEAARLGAAIHGEAAELAVTASGQRLERGLLATDLFPYIRQLVNP
jgi:NAD(P)H-hydrate epimerase